MQSYANVPRLETERLVVRLAQEADVDAVVRYWTRNREFLRPFEPARPDDFFEPSFWMTQLRQNVADCHAHRAARFFLFPKEAGGEVIGTANFTRMERGISHSCSLGYGLSEAEQGRGYMREALEAAIPFVFRSYNLHRIEANYMPHNRRSGRLLRRLGFVVEGYARDYLRIDGRWEDHVLTSRTNPDWRG
jgi:ribosomal-protein-alanine N-acetyltransferase